MCALLEGLPLASSFTLVYTMHETGFARVRVCIVILHQALVVKSGKRLWLLKGLHRMGENLSEELEYTLIGTDR